VQHEISADVTFMQQFAEACFAAEEAFEMHFIHDSDSGFR
jgi:hypothetical protein